jgi:hypothetical protein
MTNSWRSSGGGAAGCPAAFVAGRSTMLRTMAKNVFMVMFDTLPEAGSCLVR